MEQKNIIKIDAFTKIIYSFFYFFTPILFCFIISGKLDANENISAIFGLIAFVTAILFLIIGINEFKKFLIIQQDKIYICKGSENKFSIIETIEKAEVQDIDKNMISGIRLKCINRSINVLSYIPLFCCTILLLGPLMVPFLAKQYKIIDYYKLNLKNFIDGTIDFENAIVKKKDEHIINIFCILFLLFIGLIAFIGIIYFLLTVLVAILHIIKILM